MWSGFLGLLKVLIPSLEVHLEVTRGERSFTVDVAPDGEGLVSHAGAALLAEVADRVGLTVSFADARGVRERRGRHDPGRVIRDLAVMLADGGDCLSDLRAVRDQEPLFGPVASNSTAFRLIDRIAGEPGCSTRCAGARSSTGAGVGAGRAAGADRDRYRRDADRRPHREGGRGGQLQVRVRIPPTARVLG